MSYWHFEDLDRGQSPGYSQYGGKDVSDFYGGRDPYAFQDWLDALEDYLEWIGISPNRKVCFVKMMLKGEARVWWHSVAKYHHRLRLPPISDWEVMKIKLQEKYEANHHAQYPQPQQFTQHEEVLIVSYNNHDPNASMAESQFERLEQQISNLMQMMEETNSRMATFLNGTLAKVSLSKSLAPSPSLLANLPEQQPTKDTQLVNPKQPTQIHKPLHTLQPPTAPEVVSLPPPKILPLLPVVCAINWASSDQPKPVPQPVLRQSARPIAILNRATPPGHHL
jgi:hypothetical protein